MSEYNAGKYRVDYGPIGKTKKFTDSHPAVMEEKVKAFNWADQLNYTKKFDPNIKNKRHEKIKYRLLTFIEKIFFKEFGIFTLKNYNLLKR
jgi:hypothetical protein